MLLAMQLWFELYRPPSGRESDLLEEVLASWFMLGRLGAYNAQNLQVPSLQPACSHSARLCFVHFCSFICHLPSDKKPASADLTLWHNLPVS